MIEPSVLVLVVLLVLLVLVLLMLVLALVVVSTGGGAKRRPKSPQGRPENSLQAFRGVKETTSNQKMSASRREGARQNY